MGGSEGAIVLANATAVYRVWNHSDLRTLPAGLSDRTNKVVRRHSKEKLKSKEQSRLILGVTKGSRKRSNKMLPGLKHLLNAEYVATSK